MNRTIVTTVAGLALTATAAATGATAYAAPHAPQAGRAYSVSISVNDDSPVVGDTLKIKGTVSPAAPGKSVRLQVKYAGQKKWKSLGTDRLSQNSKYKFKDEVGSVRSRNYRVVKTASGGHAGRTSSNVKVVSYGWRSLTSLDAVASNGISRTSSVGMNGVAFSDSLLQYVYASGPNPGSVGYNLNRACLEFRGRVGLSDTSPVAGSAAITLSSDGVQKYAGTFGLTQSADVSFDVSNVFRLSVASASTNGGLGAVGTPEVLCSF